MKWLNFVQNSRMPEVLSKPKTTKKQDSKSNSYDKSIWLQWFEVMYRIRKFEERTLMAYSQQKIRGFCHVYIGQEAIAAGLVTAIRKEDAVVTAYRQHGIALSRGISSRSCMAELFGKETGCVKGKGGSMHFFSAEHRFFGGNGIVGAQIPIGTGIAFAEQYKGTDLLCVTMFGDGAARQGALYESFNMAMNWKLPVIYLVENNGYAMGTSIERTSNVHELYKIGATFDMPSKPVDAMDPVAVHESLIEAAKYCRQGSGPFFLEMNTYRYRGHSVSDPGNYRSKDELEYYKTLDPVITTESRILTENIANAMEIQSIKDKIHLEIDDAIKFAEESAYPSPEGLYEDNYVQQDYPYIKD